MDDNRVGVRDLRNKGGDVLDRVMAGERIVVTKSGKPVAELRPLRTTVLSRAALLARWRHLPVVDLDTLRADTDRLIDPGL